MRRRAHSERRQLAAARCRMPGSSSRYSSVIAPGVLAPVESARPRKLAAHRVRQSVAEATPSRSSDTPPPSSNVPHGAIRRRTPTDLDERGNAAGDHRRAAGHRFSDGQSETFALGGLQQHCRTAVKRREHAAIDERQDGHRVPQPELPDLAFLRRGEGVADANQSQRRTPRGAEPRTIRAARRCACGESCCRRAAARVPWDPRHRAAPRPHDPRAHPARWLHVG